MKIQLEQIRGSLRRKVDMTVSELELAGNTIIAYFLFDDVDHEYSWRSKGKHIAIRYKTPDSQRHEYHDKAVYFLKSR
jgi:hypothetical protein